APRLDHARPPGVQPRGREATSPRADRALRRDLEELMTRATPFGASRPPIRMRRVARALVCLGLTVAAAASSASAQIGGCTPTFTDPVYYEIQTPLGSIPLELYPHMAPQTVANFRAYADGGDWNGTIVHRSVPGFVIQGGGYREVSGAYQAIPTDPAVP